MGENEFPVEQGGGELGQEVSGGSFTLEFPDINDPSPIGDFLSKSQSALDELDDLADAEEERAIEYARQRDLDAVSRGRLREALAKQAFMDLMPQYGDFDKLDWIVDFLIRRGANSTDLALKFVNEIAVKGNPHRTKIDRVFEYVLAEKAAEDMK